MSTPYVSGGSVSVDPATEEFIESFPEDDPPRATAILADVHDAWITWKDLPVTERADVVLQIASLLEERSERLAITITTEMGKPISEARAEITKCIFGCRWFAEEGPRLLADQRSPSDSPNSLVVFEPLGVILAIMPWNFPFWQVFRHAAPALTAGDAILLKHSPNVGRCATEIEAIVREAAGAPLLRNTFTTPPLEFLIADPRVAGVTLTGSTRAGREVAALAGRHLKPSVLELGGSDAFIVMPDADLPEAIAAGVASRFQNTGQSCIAAKRFIGVGPVYDALVEGLVQAAGTLRVGDPKLETTQIGPLAREDLLRNIADQVERSVAMGAKVMIGGSPLPGPGYFYPPTVLTDVTPDMPVAREETFGPVAVVMSASTPQEAIEIANDSDYGLGGNIWTRDIDAAMAMASKITTGGVFINGMTHSDPRIPFGGVKASGYGRELGEFGLKEFTNIKTVWMP